MGSIMKTLTINGTKYDLVPSVPASSVTLLASAWESTGDEHSQVVAVPNVTSHTKVDLQPTAEQLAEFHHKVLGFVAENDDGTVTVYAIGDKPANDHTIQITLTEVAGTGKIRGNTVGTTMPRPDWAQTDPKKADYIKNKDLVASRSYVNEMVKGLTDRVVELEYRPMEILGISNTIGTKELGTVVQSATVSWSLNKDPESQSLNGIVVAPGDRESTVGPVSESTKFIIEATDERGVTVEKSTWAYFYNGIYYGVLVDGVTLDSVAIMSLNKKIQSGIGVTFTVNAEVGQRIAYALPAGRKTPSFWSGGLEGGFYLATPEPVVFTNGSGYTEPYNVWLSEETELGNTTITVQ